MTGIKVVASFPQMCKFHDSRRREHQGRSAGQSCGGESCAREGMEWVKGVPGASGLQQWGPGSRARPQLRALPCGRCAEELAPERSTAAPRQPGQRKTLMRRRHARYDEKAARKIHEYRELYRDHRRQLDFVPAIASTLGRIHCELLRLLFLHEHRETTRFFEIMDDEHAEPHTHLGSPCDTPTAALLS